MSTVQTDARRQDNPYLFQNAGYLSSRPQSVSADVYKHSKARPTFKSRSAPDLGEVLFTEQPEKCNWGLPLDEYGTLKARKAKKEAPAENRGQGAAARDLRIDGQSEARKLLLRDVDEESSVSRVSRWLKNI